MNLPIPIPIPMFTTRLRTDTDPRVWYISLYYRVFSFYFFLFHHFLLNDLILFFFFFSSSSYIFGSVQIILSESRGNSCLRMVMGWVSCNPCNPCKENETNSIKRGAGAGDRV
ncbi:hypothetical protein L228DRAFT_146856 [Xylona heveae TC161]|uniref:Uncharacterized protein n=1 Tax=Xylona heveae (strain CBS 132557 / TC161) TaxID=1328760 RepID=A0A165GFH5_XYLHT|nr:hypothetical protein L228DRAFT_146856 [Xylona heveae TC161]KZF22121.1 hypothetical protein L228DRAFT_146856 [Xylona heveae TC161]